MTTTKKADARTATPSDTNGWDFVAVQAINHNNVRAYNPGDLVHADNVEAHGYLDDGLVEKRDSAAATELNDELLAGQDADTPPHDVVQS